MIVSLHFYRIIYTEKRITNYIRDGLVNKEVLNKNNGQQINGYKLTNKWI